MSLQTCLNMPLKMTLKNISGVIYSKTRTVFARLSVFGHAKSRKNAPYFIVLYQLEHISIFQLFQYFHLLVYYWSNLFVKQEFKQQTWRILINYDPNQIYCFRAKMRKQTDVHLDELLLTKRCDEFYLNQISEMKQESFYQTTCVPNLQYQQPASRVEKCKHNYTAKQQEQIIKRNPVNKAAQQDVNIEKALLKFERWRKFDKQTTQKLFPSFGK
ncbi:Hypothetical_protein [Hexamita inflata]|uniref:Hypothetical_protein n=1 Tax=Hexamita inflata TaxID=28002 RepID=A0ABP1H1L0_9EUKA